MNFAYPEDGWRFLSGDLASINRFMDAIGFRFTRQGRDFIHPVVLVVTAPGGKVVRYLYGQNFMPFDLTMAVTEASHGTIGLSVKRVLSYCFTYDPEGRRYVFDFMRIAGMIILFGAAVLLFVLLRGGPRRKERKGAEGPPSSKAPPTDPPPPGSSQG
nr:ORF3 [Desulfovibrio vulgaris] [Nitratidesulfovibrio vulgaris str. 'Miyazaki F']